jgi:homospermidine synthase
MDYQKYTAFGGNLVMIGFGSIGQGVLPLILRHIDISQERITIITADKKTATGHGIDIASELGINHVTIEPLTRENYRDILTPLLTRGDFLLNLSVDVSSVALVELARELGVLYLDTCIEPWPGGYTDPNATIAERSNYALRETARALKTDTTNPTALIAHGANPGLVSHMVKEALLNLAKDAGMQDEMPASREEWGKLAQSLGVKVIHIAERDTQASPVPKTPEEFVNTWSIPGFHSEGAQPSEMGWGTHEKSLPSDGREHKSGCKAAVYLEQPGYETQVRTWTPLAGTFVGYQITHNESISIADYFTLRDGDTVTYRPTVHYAYHPCDAAIIGLRELHARNGKLHDKHRLIMDDIVDDGVDELGVLLMGHEKGAYWYGSQLSMRDAKKLAPHNNATSLQVTAPVLAGMIWAMENPSAGLVEADEIDHVRVMEIIRPYIEPVVGAYSDWTPLEGRLPADNPGFPQDIDADDPWQYKNFRVS